MREINTVLLDMDTNIDGSVTSNSDGSYTVFINSRLTYEKQKEVYAHEVFHIINDDFCCTNSDSIELIAHGM